MSKTSKPREIRINECGYLWVVCPLDPHFVEVRVWSRERNRKDFPLEIRLRFDDPWLNYGPLLTCPPERLEEVFQSEPVTPGLVRRLIDAALSAGWGPHHPSEPRLFVWNGREMHQPKT